MFGVEKSELRTILAVTGIIVFANGVSRYFLDKIVIDPMFVIIIGFFMYAFLPDIFK